MSDENIEIYSEDAEIQALYEKVNFSLDARDFIEKNKVGRALMAEAARMLMEARTQLETVAPTDVEAISTLQVESRAARTVINTLGGIITDGNGAAEQLHQLDRIEE